MSHKRQVHAGAVFKLFWDHTKRYPWLFTFALLGTVLSQLSNIIGPLYMRDLFNVLANHAPSSQTMQAVVAILISYTVISLVGWVGGRLDMWLGYKLIAHVTANLTIEAFQNLMHQSYRFFTSSFSGALTRKVSRFSGAYENLYYAVAISIFQAVLYMAGIIIVLLFQNQLLGEIIIAWVVIFIALQWWLNRIQQPYRILRAKADTDLTATLSDSISNQNTVALFSANAFEEKTIILASNNLRDAQNRSWNLNSLIYGFQGLFTNILNIGMLAVGVSLWFRGVISLGDVVLIQAYVFGIFSSVWNLGRQFHIIYNSLADATEMLEIMHTVPDVTDIKNAKKLKVSAGEIWFDDVSFHFNKEAPVLNRFNLKINGSERVALVGSSGAGKSTVTKLLLRLYDITEGEIKIDGQNIQKVTQDSLRNNIAFVPQEPILFHRSLMENIRYGRRDATDAEVIEAAKLAHCHEFISKLHLGYDTLVGERGIKLSGGERQRVAIARAILKNAPLLILDEATSSLDSESESLIQDALEVLMQGKTVVVIAHRLSTIMKMDRIVVMEKGEISANGTHLELLNEDGLYKKLWSIQAGGFLKDEDAEENAEKIDEVEISAELAED